MWRRYRNGNTVCHRSSHLRLHSNSYIRMFRIKRFIEQHIHSAQLQRSSSCLAICLDGFPPIGWYGHFDYQQYIGAKSDLLIYEYGDNEYHVYNYAYRCSD